MDAKLTEKFQQLKNDIVPRSEWMTLNRDLLLHQIKTNQAPVNGIGFFEYLSLTFSLARQQFLQPAVVMLTIFATFVGSSLTINAAFYSLPGETLYSMKLALEKTHVALTPGDNKKVELRIEFAQKRVAEFDKIVAGQSSPEEKKRNIETVVKELTSNVSSVNNHLKKSTNSSISENSDKVRMAVAVSHQAEELNKTLDKTLDALSDGEKEQVQALVAPAVAAVQETEQAAQQIVADAKEEASATEQSAGEQGTVEGVTNLDNSKDEKIQQPVEPDSAVAPSDELAE